MALKGGPRILLLIVAGAVLATPSDAMGKNRPNYKNVVRKLMMKCRENGHAVPQMSLLKTVFSESNIPIEGRDGNQAETLLSPFLRLLNSATGENNMAPVSPAPAEDPDQMKNKLWKCRHLSAILKKMRNATEAPACYMRAYMAPVAWASLRAQCENDVVSNEYEALLWAAKPMLEESPSARRDLPTELDEQRMKPMMKMLQDVYFTMADSEKTWVAKWARNQIIQNKFNCTMSAPSDPRSSPKKQCTAPQRQLSLEVLTVMGSFMSHMTTTDVDSSRKEKMCDFFSSGLLDIMKDTMPTRCKWFLKTYQDCFSGEEYHKHLDKLGPLTCCLSKLPDIKQELPLDVRKKVLAQLDHCQNSKTTNLKKRLVNLYMQVNSSAQALLDLGKNAMFLTPKQFLNLNPKALREVLKNQNLQWTQSQQCMLVKKQLGDQCNKTSYKELKDFQTLAQALPVCVIRRLKDEILSDTEALKNISRKMRKGQLKAMLQNLPPDVLRKMTMKMPQRLACAVSLSTLKKANITYVQQMENNTWCRSQAAYLAKRMKDGTQVKFRKMRSLLGGFTCKMIQKAADIKELAQAMDEVPQWVSKAEFRCVVRNLTLTLEKERKDYFKTITEEELENIPTMYFLHLPPPTLRDLPDSVCPTFLEKLEQANMSVLPLRAWSRPALISRALRCLANGADLSGLTMTDVSILGELVCELPPSKLTLMAPNVLNATLERMANCEYIPKRHQKDLTQLVRKTFGDPSNWTAETTETIGSLFMLDDDDVSALPKKPWMKDIFYFLMSKKRHVSNALKKKWFEFATDPSSETTDGQKNFIKPTEQLIDEVGMSNSYWKPSQLDAMSKETFVASVETLGSSPDFSAEQLAVLRRKATEAFGPVSQMADCQVMQLGCITQGFSDADLETLSFPLDSLEEISKCAWTESQMRSAWKGIAKRYDLTASQLSADEMVVLNRFMCGLNISEIQQLPTEAFKDAVGAMDGIRCSSKIMKHFKKVAVAAFGAPDTWDEAQTSELSNIIPGLDASELASLDPSTFSFINEMVIPEIPPDSLKALSDDQLRSFGPVNAAMVTSAQLGALSVSQRAALDEAATGSQSRSETPEDSGENSGAPSLSVEGISALLKPFLFLCMGFLLL